VKLKMADGEVRILHNVRYVLELRRNLISLGMLDSMGYTSILTNGIISVIKGSEVFLKGIRKHDLYFLNENAVFGQVYATKNLDTSLLWHGRLGHISERGMQELIKQNLLCGETSVNLKLCEHCVMGKSKRVKFGVGEHTSISILDYIHSDLWGPSKNPTKGGGKYFILFIDDFSRKAWIYILKSKDEAFGKFKDWLTEVENITEKTLKCFRADNGLEYLLDEFNKFCRDRGIKRHRTVPSTPQQNRVAEG